MEGKILIADDETDIVVMLWMERIYPFLERDTAICWDICRSILDTILSLLLGIF